MNAILSLSRAAESPVDTAHRAYLQAAIANYERKAEHARKLSQEALRRGNRTLSLGLMEASLTYAAMADGLIEQTHNQEEPQ